METTDWNKSYNVYRNKIYDFQEKASIEINDAAWERLKKEIEKTQESLVYKAFIGSDSIKIEKENKMQKSYRIFNGYVINKASKGIVYQTTDPIVAESEQDARDELLIQALKHFDNQFVPSEHLLIVAGVINFVLNEE